MPRDPGPGYVNFVTRLDTGLHTRFINRFPQNGANVWWVNTMMRAFLDRVEDDPDYREQMQEALELAVERTREAS